MLTLISRLFEYGIQVNVAPGSQKYANLFPAITLTNTHHTHTPTQFKCLPFGFEQGEPKGRQTHSPKTKLEIWLFLAFALDLTERPKSQARQTLSPTTWLTTHRYSLTHTHTHRRGWLTLADVRLGFPRYKIFVQVE